MPRAVADKISLAALSLTMAVVLLLGGASYLFSYYGIKRQAEDRLAVKATLLAQRISSWQESLASDLLTMSKNLLVVNALADSEGRDKYLEPFLRSYQVPHYGHAPMSLCDFEGKPLVVTPGTYALKTCKDGAVLEHVIRREQPLVRLDRTASGEAIFFAVPVVYQATGSVEGMLVLSVPLATVIGTLAGESAPGVSSFVLRDDNGILWHGGGTMTGPVVSTSVKLASSSSPMTLPQLELQVSEPSSQVYADLNILTLIYLGIGLVVLLLVGLLSRVIGRQLTAPLLDLTNRARQVAGQDGTSPEGLPRHENEIEQLSAAFSAMLIRVTERTEELRLEVLERAKAEEEAHIAAERKKVLLREVNHRVKNNLVAIISMLHQEEDRARLAGKLEYLERLQEVVWRVTGLLTVHRLLSSSEWSPLSLSILCEHVIREAVKGLAPSLSLEVAVMPSQVYVDSNQAHYLAMILNELTTNTMKYALRDRVHGRITVEIVLRENNCIELCYRDDGPGLPPSLLCEEASRGQGVGFPLIFGLIRRSMQGSISLANNMGAEICLVFPAMVQEPDKQQGETTDE